MLCFMRSPCSRSLLRLSSPDTWARNSIGTLPRTAQVLTGYTYPDPSGNCARKHTKHPHGRGPRSFRACSLAAATPIIDPVDMSPMPESPSVANSSSAASTVEGSDTWQRPLRAILFDVDGTLADSDPLHFLAFQTMLQEAGFNGGVPITEEFFRARISGRHNPDIMEDLFPEWDEERKAEFTEKKEATFRRMALSNIKPVPGLAEFCDWVLEQKLLRAAVTNAPRANAEQMIRGLGLEGFFQHLVIGSECTRAKPFPEPYQVAMDLLSVYPEESFALEDSPSGVRSAVSARLPTVGLLTGQSEGTLVQAGVTLAIPDYRDARLWDFLRLRMAFGTV